MPFDAPPLAWLFLDMNSFFASIEQHLRPELRGRPVGVIPLESEHTCVIAASREAKACGVKSVTSVREARQVCPDIRLVRARPAVYVQVHHAVAQSIDRCAPVHKAYSIDEWAVRLCGAQRDPEQAVQLGRRIRAQIRNDHSEYLPCSIGIAPTRLLAKIACDLHKPDGLTVLQTHELPHRLEHFALRDLCGIGRGMATRLERQGIRTVRDLWMLTRTQAIEAWGSISGAHWWAGFHGHDEPEVPTRKRSMTHANVLEPRFRHPVGARAMLVRLVCRLGARLRYEQYLAGALSVRVSDTEGGHFSAALELPHVQDTPTLLEALYELWDRRDPTSAPPHTVTATVFGLAPAAQIAGHLFPEADRAARLSHAMDEINQRWGISSLYFGSMHDCRHPMDDKIAFGRIPPSVPKPPDRKRTAAPSPNVGCGSSRAAV